jgi:dGTPase
MVQKVLQAFKERYHEILTGEYHQELLFDEACEASVLATTCKRILRENLYKNREILKLEIRGRKVIHDLMDMFWEAATAYSPGKMSPRTYAGKIYLLMSDNYRRSFEQRLEKGESSLYCKLQLVADQVAGMTDAHACRLHKDLLNG